MTDMKPVKPIRVAYEEFIKNKNVKESEILQFKYPGNHDIYNPSVPFESDGKEMMACRVQGRNERDSKIVFFVKNGKVYELVTNAPTFDLEDPFVTMIDGEIILGGVHVEWEGTYALSWRTVFYKGQNIYKLEHLLDGPDHMKDIRLLQLPDGKIAVCSRPQGEAVMQKYGCIAKIGFTILPGLSSLTAEAIENAPFIQDVFLSDEWGGVNQMHYLPDGKIGMIGHISYKTIKETQDILHYYSVAFTLDTGTLTATPPKVICSRDCFQGTDAREPRLYDVTFCAGITNNHDSTAYIYTGLSDCQIGRALIPQPFQ